MRRLFTSVFLTLTVSTIATASSERVVLEFFDYSLALKVDRSTPNVRVFDSGRIEVHVPSHKMNPGRYQLWTTEAKQQDLFALAQQLVPTNSVALLDQAEAQVRSAKPVSQARFRSSQSRLTRIRLHQNDQVKDLVFLNLDQYPAQAAASSELDRFRELVTELRSIQRDQRRQRIGDTVSVELAR